MTDAPKDGDNELVLDWDDDAVESFRLDLEDSARAEAAPFPQRALAPDQTPPAAGTGAGGTLPAAARLLDNERPTLPPVTEPPAYSDPLAVFESLVPPPPKRGPALTPDVHGGAAWQPNLRSPATISDSRSGAAAPPMAPAGAAAPPFGSGGAGAPPVGSGGAGAPPVGSGGAGAPPGMRNAGSPPRGTPAATPLHPGPPPANPFGRTLSGIAPVAPRGGGLFMQQQRKTLRPSEVLAKTPTAPRPAPDTEEPTRPGEKPGAAQAPRPQASLYDSLPSLGLDDDDDSDATQVASVPRELIEALLGAQNRHNRVTERPPPAPLPQAESGLEPQPDASDTEPPPQTDAEIDELEDFLLGRLEEQPVEPPTGLRPLPPPAPATLGAPGLPPPKPAALPPAPPGLPPARLAPPQAPLAAPARIAWPTEPAPVTEAVLDDLDELLPPVTSAPSADKPVPIARVVRADHGAKAAQTMGSTPKARPEAGPLAALDDSGRRARIALLEALARVREGRTRALLLVTAAELSEELNDAEGAKERYQRAHEAAPKLMSPIWALARFAFEARDMDQHLDWLAKASAAATAPHTRAAALAASARVHWLVQRDLPAALRAATEAAELCPDDVAHRLLETRIALATHAQHADQGLLQLSAALGADPVVPALALFAGRARESRNDTAAARAAYRSASQGPGNQAEAQLLLARLARSEGQREDAGEALGLAASALPAGTLAGALRRHAAVLLGQAPARRAEALALLAEPPDAVSARSAVALAEQSADPSAAARARKAWLQHAEGRELALAWLSEAEARQQDGQLAEAADALEQALAQDRTLSLTRVLWELLARDSGDLPRYLARTGSAGANQSGLLRAAAKLACERTGAAAEADLLAQIAGAREQAVARALRVDARAESGQLSTILDELVPLTRESPSPSLFMLCADIARRVQGEEASLELYARATELFPDEPQITRAWARSAENSSDVARALSLEAGSARGARAAFLHLLTGQLSLEPAQRLMAFERAYEALPSYAPAVFALHSETRRQNELARLANLHSREAARAKDPFEVVSHLIRAALVRAHDDGDAAAAQLTRALDLAPSDPVLRELVIRLGDAVPASLRAEAMQRIAERAAPPFDRPATLAAAGAFEDAGQAERALSLYESVLRSYPEDPVSELGRERVARAAGRARELLEAKRRAIHEASTDARRLRALEDLLQADTDAPAEESLDRARALLVLSPTHPLALRRTERHAMERGDADALLDTELRILGSSEGPKDKLARLRLLTLLTSLKRGDRARADDLDQVLAAQAPSTHGGPWLSRQLMGAGIALGDASVVLKALDLAADETHEPVELASLAVRRARLALPTPPHDRETKLRASLAAYPDHPTGLEALAELVLARDQATEAAGLFTQAADRALHPPRAARLWARAAQLYQELEQPELAKAAFTRAVEADIGFEDVETKLRALFEAESDLDGMIKLISARLAKGVAPEQALPLRLNLAALHERRENAAAALVTLREALELAPEDLTVLRELARLLAEQQDPRERAQVLLRIARISREPLELRDVFMRLGEIYDSELPDPKRAEAAYQRALKLGPRHVPALERLAALYRREGQTEQAEACLSKLVELADTPATRLLASLTLSQAQEARGDTRSAEETLDVLRRQQPFDADVLRALADFYKRQGALSALAMHLNRAISDLRSAVEADPSRASEWISLVQVLDDKHRPDAARVAAAAACACGVADPRLRTRLDADGDVPGVASAAFSELLDDLVFGDDMPPSTRIVFRHGAEALNKSAPLDLRAIGAERLDRRHPLRAVVNEVARWAGIGDVDVFTSAQLPLAFVPIQDAPAQLLVGQSLLDHLSRKEQLFLTARALKIARAHMSLTCRVRPEEMGLLLHGMIRSQLPTHVPDGVDLAGMEDMARRVSKHLSKRVVPELTPHLMELVGVAHFDPARVYAVASTAGNRAGLLAIGSPGAALTALGKLAGLRLGKDFDQTLLEKVEEARDLLNFTLSEAHFEARLRAGVDLR